MALPIVALVSMGVSEGLDADYDHPLINELKKEGTLSAYLLAVFCAVLVAPLVEEFFFRVMLQGWLESVQWSWRGWWWLLGANANQAASLIADSAAPGSLAVVTPETPPGPTRSSNVACPIQLVRAACHIQSISADYRQ